MYKRIYNFRSLSAFEQDVRRDP